MEQFYISELKIKKVRHLNNMTISLSKNGMKHLIITGKNGSGKTSILEAIVQLFQSITSINDTVWKNFTSVQEQQFVDHLLEQQNVEVEFNVPLKEINIQFRKGAFIVGYYKAERKFEAEIPKHVEKVDIKENYGVTETPRENFIKYLLDLKMTQALAIAGGKAEKAESIKVWFENFEHLLQKIFEDSTLNLEFDEDTFTFHLYQEGREAFDFNTLSSGYAAILDIVVDIMLRMEKYTNKKFQYDMAGIILIDEIETHLHLKLQRKILDWLTTIFPNIQFIVSTHSPFILNSIENVVIYDLEQHTLIEHGLIDVPYEGIVEGYFKADSMSDLLKEKYESYKELVKKEELSDEDFEEIAKLEIFLEEIPDYLAFDITTEYKRLKLEFENREDI